MVWVILPAVDGIEIHAHTIEFQILDRLLWINNITTYRSIKKIRDEPTPSLRYIYRKLSLFV